MFRDRTIRLAKSDEAQAIAAMSRDWIEHGLGWSWTAARVSQAIHDPSTNVAVLTGAGRQGGGALISTD